MGLGHSKGTSCRTPLAKILDPPLLQNAVCPVASAESRRRLRSASSADLIVPATPRRTTMCAGARLRRRSTARLQQSAGRDPSQLIAGRLQTLSENSRKALRVW